MTEAEFHELVDETLERFEMAVENAADDADRDVDCDESGGVLTVTFDNGSSLIFSRQPAMRQLWLAARSGGYHFEYSTAASAWVCTRSGDTLHKILELALADQAGLQLDA